jgi:hypothetical protein
MKALKVRVYHGGYGCDTGCCGHWVEIPRENGEGPRRDTWAGFTHANDLKDQAAVLAWARTLAEKTIKENWPECIDSIDWESLDIEWASDGGNC